MNTIKTYQKTLNADQLKISQILINLNWKRH